MALFSRKRDEGRTPAATRPAAITEADIADARQLMDRWDQSVGNSDAMWDCLGAIGRRGGYRGAEATMLEVSRGADSGEVLDRPWQWLNTVAETTNARGDDILTGRVFLFTYFFVNIVVPRMQGGDGLETGLSKPKDSVLKGIATLAVQSLSRLDPNMMIHDTATGQVDVAGALQMAETVSSMGA